MAAPGCGKGSLGGATLSEKHTQPDPLILRASRDVGKLQQQIEIEYAPAVFAAPLSRGRKEFFVSLRGVAKRSAVLLVASVAVCASRGRS